VSAVSAAVEEDQQREADTASRGFGTAQVFGEGAIPMDLEYDPATRRFAAQVLRELADMLDGDDDDESDFIDRWREYERARRNGDSRVIEDDG